MTSHHTMRLALSVLAFSSFGHIESALSQSPFTIRRPPDGATVREKVRIEIPRSSIHHGGFVAMYIDDKFEIAVAPAEGDELSSKPFIYVWDTKESKTPDGLHTIRTVLFEPAGGSGDGIAATEKGSSEVKLEVANKIKNGPASLLLRYHYYDGEDLKYQRESKAVIAGGISDIGAADDQQLMSISSTHLFDIEDVRPAVSLVRNKLTSLSILTGGQETKFPASSLSNSMYQEIDPVGAVQYETGTSSGLEEFANQGLPVNNSLELPLLPSSRVAIGQTWHTTGQRLDIPGLPPSQQPKVTLLNKLVDLEWQNGYPTALIHQTFEANAPVKTVTFGQIGISSPNVKYERDIYIAYKSGKLIKTSRTLSISGTTTDQIGVNRGTPAAGAGMMGGPGGMMGGQGGMMAPPGMMGGTGGMAGGGRFGGGSQGMMGGMSGGGRRGKDDGGGMGGGAMGRGGMMGRGGQFGGRMGGGAMMGGGRMGGYPGAGGMMGGNTGQARNTGIPAEAMNKPITIRAVTVTTLQ